MFYLKKIIILISIALNIFGPELPNELLQNIFSYALKIELSHSSKESFKNFKKSIVNTKNISLASKNFYQLIKTNPNYVNQDKIYKSIVNLAALELIPLNKKYRKLIWQILQPKINIDKQILFEQVIPFLTENKQEILLLELFKKYKLQQNQQKDIYQRYNNVKEDIKIKYCESIFITFFWSLFLISIILSINNSP